MKVGFIVLLYSYVLLALTSLPTGVVAEESEEEEYIDVNPEQQGVDQNNDGLFKTTYNEDANDPPKRELCILLAVGFLVRLNRADSGAFFAH